MLRPPGNTTVTLRIRGEDRGLLDCLCYNQSRSTTRRGTTSMWSLLIRRFRWLDPYHPIAVRESRRNYPELPRFIRKLTDPWTMLGYAAMLHGIFFILSLIGYSRINR